MFFYPQHITGRGWIQWCLLPNHMDKVRVFWNQHIVIDCSLSHAAGHQPFTCSHLVCMYHVT